MAFQTRIAAPHLLEINLQHRDRAEDEDYERSCNNENGHMKNITLFHKSKNY